MMVRKFFGLFALVTSLCFGLLQAPTAQAQPAPTLADEISAIEEAALRDWALESVQPDEPLDEQIFTQISPLLDTPDAVKLPPDQQPED